MKCSSLYVGLCLLAGLSAGCANFSQGPAALLEDATVTPVRLAAYHPSQLRVMSFNLRVPFVFDLWNYWPNRKDLVAQTIRQFNPDVLGTQECVWSQAQDLMTRLPAYQFVGVGRDDGKHGGEMCGIFFKRDRFTLLDSGTFWLSETPHEVGSKSWGAWWPRIVTWVKLQPRVLGGQPFYFFNTHMAALSGHAREQGAALLRQRLASIAGASPFILTGDFNADAGSDAYRILLDGRSELGAKLVDAYRAAHPVPGEHEASHGGFGGSRSGDRIDWIVTPPSVRTLFAAIDHANDDGRYPSDHFPVTAVVQLPEPSTPTLASAKTAEVEPGIAAAPAAIPPHLATR